LKDIFRYQIWHLLSVATLLALVYSFVLLNDELLNGSLWGIHTTTWFWSAITVPIFHQVYVWIIWRLELYKRTFTSRFGLKRAFHLYQIGFSILFVSRLIFITILALSSRDSLAIDPVFSYLIIATITPAVIYLFYSVKVYFTIERAYGIDHFDKGYNAPYVKAGIFRYTDNGMYIFGLMILYLPGLLLFSKAALVVAIFNHLYIWVHYYCTERPDMQVIYGKTPGEE